MKKLEQVSLFSRLILVFILTAVGLSLVAINTFKHVAEEKPNRIMPLQLLQGVSSLLPVNQRASSESIKLVRSMVGEFIVIEPNNTWGSVSDVDLEKLPACGFVQSRSYEILNKLVLFRDINRCIVFLGLTKKLSAEGKWYIFLGTLGSFLVLFIAYIIIYRLFYPLHLINEGVNKIASGDISFRLKSKNNDELGELVNNVNIMADQIEQMLEAKSDLLLAVSHELRSPLTQARVLVEMVHDKKIKTRLCRSLDTLSGLVTSLLDAERLKQQHAILIREETDIIGLVEELLSEMNESLVSFSASELRPRIPLDQLRVKLMIKNLLTNALLYAGGKIHISVEQKPDFVEISIADYGPGIPPETLAKLGTAFYRPDASRIRSTGGFGLGIYLAKTIAEAHGGRLLMSSEVGKGTLVKVSLSMPT